MNKSVYKSIILIFSSLLLASCAKTVPNYVTPVNINQVTLPTINQPPKAKLYKVQWQKVNNMYCVDTSNVKKLIFNIRELKQNNKLLRLDLDMVTNFNKDVKQKIQKK